MSWRQVREYFLLRICIAGARNKVTHKAVWIVERDFGSATTAIHIQLHRLGTVCLEPYRRRLELLVHRPKHKLDRNRRTILYHTLIRFDAQPCRVRANFELERECASVGKLPNDRGRLANRLSTEIECAIVVNSNCDNARSHLERNLVRLNSSQL